MGHPKEYNVNQQNKLSVGDKLSDGKNSFIVTRLIYSQYSHSQYASEVEVECVKGPRKGTKFTCDHYVATSYKV
jgi:hypothetical protein